MKKFIMALIIILIIILIGVSCLLKKDNKTELKKIKVADTTITSRKYMSWFNQYI